MLFRTGVKYAFLSLLLLQQSGEVMAQSRMFFSAGAGAVYYNGDLRDKNYFPPSQLIHPIGDINVGYNISRHFDLTLNYYRGKVDCADSLADELDNILRNQNFRSQIDEVNFMLRFKLFKIDQHTLFNPYIMAGFGWLFFNPEGYYEGSWYKLQPLGTEGQFVTATEENYPAPYSLHANTFPFGFGLTVRLSRQWRIKAEFVQHFLFTDYLDDTSTKYPDSTEVSATPNGYYAAIFSSRRLNGFPDYRRNRGNEGANDNYVNVSVGIIFNPTRKKSYQFRSFLGIFGKDYSGRKGWWGEKGKGIK